MGYMHISNLYKDQDIMMFRECYAMEKIHGSSAHVAQKYGSLRFFAGGCKHERFVEIFDADTLLESLKNTDVVVYGEVYGGKVQKMSNTYGKDLKFVAFDVKIDDLWLSVPQAEDFCKEAGIEFVHYVKIPTELAAIDAQRDADSVQAVRNGMGEGHKREGVVLRPLIEVRKNNDARIMSKHKGDDFKETKTPRPVDPERLKVLAEAQAISEEWITPMRILHVLDKIDDPCMEKMREIIAAMQEDVEREGAGEIVWSKEAKTAVSRATALGVKTYFKKLLEEK